MDKDQFNQLMNKLYSLSKLVAISIVQGKPLKNQVQTLFSAGLTTKEIADLLRTKAGNISQYVYRKKR